MTTSELDNRTIGISMRKSVENLVISSQDAIGQSISQALTFSGVITQHANQIIQENRNASRSPSPSLRSTDGGLDLIDNDKAGEMAIHVPSHPAGDSVSISSASETITVLTVGPGGKLDNPKVTSPAAPRGVDGGRTKKKSWYNALYPTYKSKSEDFKRLFKDLPDDERLIVDYSCALQKDILAHGRLYASQNYLCFYASIFGWETSLSLRWKDVTAITKEKTALVIPNAILVCTETEKNFLTSFSGRDKAYLMLFRIWQNALMDQPMTSQEIWQWVHSCYGEELGFNSDDEGYSRDFGDDVAVLPGDTASEVFESFGASTQPVWGSTINRKPQLHNNSLKQDLVDSSSMETSVGAGDGRLENRSGSRGRDSSPPLVTNGDRGYREEEGGDTLPTDMSDTSDSEPDKHHNTGEADKCTSLHDGKLLMRQEFPFNVDQLFTMIFTNSKFNLELLAARGTADYVQAPWQPQAGRKCRQCKYTLSLTSAGPIGPKEVQVTETQVMNKCSKPGQLYSIDTTSDNAGIPYADYFSVLVHYCLQRVSEHVTEFTVFGQLKYKKSMWPMVKGFLEKNTMSGLEDYCRLMETRLSAEALGAAPTTRKSRRHRRVTASSQESGTAAAAIKIPTTTLVDPRVTLPRPAGSATTSWLVGVLVLLLIINAILYWRLYHSERVAFHLDDLQNRMSSLSGAQMADWSKLLQQHTHRQRGQLLAWREALDRTVLHLSQTEQALRKLLETIKPSLERVQQEASGEASRDDL